MKMKYIRTEVMGMPMFILFPDGMTHLEIAKCISGGIPGAKVTSAGFVVNHYMDLAECQGDSVSLGMKSCENDTLEMRRQFGIMEASRWSTEKR